MDVAQSDTASQQQLDSKLAECKEVDAHTAISRRNQQESPLLRLPVEIRVMIYEFIFGGPKNPCTCSSRWNSSRRRWDHSPRTWRYPTLLLAITETCRQTYAEARLLPFALTEFAGEFDMLGNELTETLSAEQAGAVTAVRLLGDGVDGPFSSVDDVRILARFKELKRVMVTLVCCSREQKFIEDLAQAVGKGFEQVGRTDVVVVGEYC